MKRYLAFVLVAASVSLTLATSDQVHAETVFVVNSTGDGADAGSNGVCQTSTPGECTLRAALAEAGAMTSGHVTINFDIPGSGVRVIHVGSELPPVNNGTAGITIDGFSQPGSHPNTDPLVDNAVRLVEIAGGGAAAYDGFVVTGSSNTIRGLVIRSFKHDIHLSGSGSQFNHVFGNLIGLQANGAMAPDFQRLIGSACITIDAGSNQNRIGRPGNDNRNTISGCPEAGVDMEQQFTYKNLVQNNILGMDPTGTQSRPSDYGVDINWGANGNIVGGTAPQERNLVSGNLEGGIEISHGTGTVDNVVIGNLVGTDPTGNTATAATANGGVGVRIEGVPNCHTAPCAPDVSQTTVTDNVIVNSAGGGVLADKGAHDSTIARNRIGITLDGTVIGNANFGVRIAAGAHTITVGPGNAIAGSGHGVDVLSLSVQPAGTTPTPTNGNTITGNSISATALGIDLAPFDIVNTAATADPIVNEGVLPPSLLMQDTAVRAATCASCTVELFRAPGPGSSGPGVTYLSSAVAGSDGNVTFPMPIGGWGGSLTATTRTPAGSTSEFAVNLDPTVSGSSAFVPAGPVRVMDTRDGTGVAAGLRPPGSSTDLHIDVPANATAVVLNATITESVDAGYVQLFPTGSGVPGSSSNLNVPGPGVTIANLVIVPLGSNHSVTFFNHAGGHLVADLFGYFVPAGSSSSGRLVTLSAPDRVLDTRVPPQSKLGAGAQLRLPILTSATPAGGVVPPGATAVVMNVTAVDTDEPGFLQVYNDPAMKGKSSNLNFRPHDIAPNLVISPIGADGSVTIYAHSAADVVVDVIGYFTGSNSPVSTQGLYVPFTPRRLIDSRQTGGPLAQMGQRDVDLAVLAGVSPSAMAAMFTNVTLVDSVDAGWLQVFPTGMSTPGASSSVNVTGPHQIRPNAVITGHNAGHVTVVDHAGGDFIFDAAGYFTAAPG